MIYNIYDEECLKDTSGISVVIPALNEEANLRGLLEELREVMGHIEKPYEIIVVDDGSTDRTAGVAKECGCTVIRREGPEHGKGLALREGFEKSRYDIIVMMDADCSHRPKDMPFLLLELDKGHGIIVANRFLGGSGEYSPLRAIGNKALTFVFNFLFHTQLTDTLNGYKVFHRSIFDSYEYKSKEFEIEIELLANAIQLGKSIGQCPSHELARRGGKAKSFVIRHGTKFLMQIIREWKIAGVKPLKITKK